KSDGTAQNLLCDIYEPVGDAYTARPLVVVAHGGFFLSGSKTGSDVVPICQSLAKMGYVAVSIEYRLGINITADLSGPMTEAVMRGVQDGKAAVRYFRKTVAEDNNPYGIDPNQIYFAGSSAGGYIGLHMAYLDDINEIPSYVNQNAPGLTGGLEGESGNASYSSSINAIVNLAGAIGDSAWITPNDEPALLIHGSNDQTVPFGSAMQYAFGVAPVVEVDGSNSINEKMNEVNVEHCFKAFIGADHVPHVTSTAYLDTTLSYMANFLSYQVCGGTLECDYRELTVGINETSASLNNVILYPNPAKDFFAIEGNGIQNVEVFTLTGELVLQSNGKNRIEITNLVSGMYLVNIHTSNKTTTKKLIIQ
ncbi:MAG: T9SS type A sorting domain-containing protein, partial [Bacteroidota bacterium]